MALAVTNGLNMSPSRTVDADVVVPSHLFPKDEWAARTLRIKLHKVWNDYLTPHTNHHSRTPWPDVVPIAGEAIIPTRSLRSSRLAGLEWSMVIEEGPSRRPSVCGGSSPIVCRITQRREMSRRRIKRVNSPPICISDTSVR